MRHNQSSHWGEFLFDRRFDVPRFEPTLGVGSKVTWRVDSRRKNGHEPFRAVGKITKLYTTTFGGHVKKQAAKIETQGRYLEVFPGRTHTTVAVDKLKLVIT